MSNVNHPADRTISTSIDIGAPVEVVRRVLLDFASYPEWSSFITSITPSGQVAVGSKLSVRIEPPGGSGVTMTTTVVLVGDEGFGWQGHLANWPGLFDGRHMFLLQPNQEETRLEHREEFGGVLYTPLMGWLGMEAKTRKGFEQFNLDIKKRAEEVARK